MKDVRRYFDIMTTEAQSLNDIPSWNDKKSLTVTFALTLLNPIDFYRIISPAMALNRYSQEIRAIMPSMKQEIKDQPIEKYMSYLYGPILENTDVLVFPFTTEDLRKIGEQAKEYNPDLKTVMFVDYDWENVPYYHPDNEKFKQAKNRRRVIENIKYCDGVFYTNQKLYDTIAGRLDMELKGCGTFATVYPISADLDLMADMEIVENTNEEFNIGVCADQKEWENNRYIRDILLELQKTHGKKIKINVIGDGLYNNDKSCFEGLEFTHITYTDVIDYMEKLSTLNLDAFLMPIKDTAYNRTSIDMDKYITFSLLRTPVFASPIYPYNKIALHNERGVLCSKKSQWIEELNMAIEDNQKVREIADMALEITRETYIMQRIEKITWYEQIFKSL